MNNRKTIYKSILAVVFLPLLLGMCAKSSDTGPVLRTKVNLTGSTIAADQAYTRIMFSTDAGTTWSAVPPNLSVGKKYLAQVLDDNNGLYLNPASFYAVDWSLSNPKPNDATSGTPEFTFGDNNNLIVSVVDLHCPYTASTWAGAWTGKEVNPTGSTDPNNFTQDSTNPNKFTMDNYFGDTDASKGISATAYIIFSPSTTAFDQIVTLPQQTTGEGGTASGSGTYDQCRGTLTFNNTYIIGGSTYKWTYIFHR
jgi:hypothetical protein